MTTPTVAGRPPLFAAELRVLVLTPTDRDAVLTQSILGGAGMVCESCRTLTEARRLLDDGAGALLIAEEALATDSDGGLAIWLASQPPWSDLPILVLSQAGADSRILNRALGTFRNISVLERPVRVASLVSAVSTALRARHRQYQIRDHLMQRETDARRKDEFLAILAHELRNPLAPIRNGLHLLRLTGPRDATAERVNEMLERQVGHLVRLVEDLLEVSRITGGKLELRNERVDVAALVRAAIETSRPLIESAKHSLTVQVLEGPLAVNGDPVRLTQVLANLLNNAAKYTDPGGEIWLTARKDGTNAAISVRDSGMGIQPDMLPRTFDLFMQIDQRPGRVRDGLGLGLTLVKSLVELHGGTVTAQSEGVGHGSEFIVHLPLAAAPLVGEEHEDAPPPLRTLPTRRVLVVDDNRDAAESLGSLLRLLGADVQVAFDGDSALAAIPTHQPAVVLLDIGMPGMDGHEVARRIRALPGGQAMALIALTGWGQEEDRNRSRAAGFDYHLIKPADLAALESLLASLDSFHSESSLRT